MSDFDRVIDLENQLDLLALSIQDLSSKNSQLESENASLKARLAHYETLSRESGSTKDSQSREIIDGSIPNLIDHVAHGIVTNQEFKSDHYMDTQTECIKNVSGLSNPLCLAFLTLRESVVIARFGGIVSTTSGKETDFVLCGGADKQLHMYSCSASNEKLFTMTFDAPILTVDCHTSQVCCGMMDGSTACFDFRNLPPFQAVNGTCCLHYADYVDSFVYLQREHSKYVVRTRFSPDGHYYCTVSYDKRIIIYHKKASNVDNTAPIWEVSLSVNFDNTPEDAVFIQSKDGTVIELVVAVRESVCLYSFYLNCNRKWEQRFVSLNSNEWDLHASFSVLHLCVQQSNSMASQVVLCCCADNQNHYLYEWIHPLTLLGKQGDLNDNSHDIVVKTDQASLKSSATALETSKCINILVGHNCSQYGKPVVSWSSCGRYLYSNSENETDIVVYDTFRKGTSNFIVNRLSAHQNIVRCVAHHPWKHLFASISYDKNLLMWTCSTLRKEEKEIVTSEEVTLTVEEEEILAALRRDMSSSLQVKESWLCQCARDSAKSSDNNDINNNSFYGLFATRNFAEGEVVCIYYGHEYRTKEALKIVDKSYLMRLGEQCYVDTRLPIPSEKILNLNIEYATRVLRKEDREVTTETEAIEAIEATKEMYCIARYINDCINPAGYNVQFEKRPLVKPFACAIVRAIRPIKEGEEIFVSYGKRYWEGCEKKATRIGFMELHKKKEALA